MHTILFSDFTVHSQSLSVRTLSIKTERLTDYLNADSLWLKREPRKGHARFRIYHTYVSLSEVGKIDVAYAEARAKASAYPPKYGETSDLTFEIKFLALNCSSSLRKYWSSALRGKKETICLCLSSPFKS